MTLLKNFAIAAAFAALTATVPAQARVSVDQVPSAALTRGSTFAWAPVAASGYGTPNPEVINQIAVERLRRLTEATLASHGFRMVANPAEAEVLVSYTVIMLPEEATRLTTAGTGCGLPPCTVAESYRLDSRRFTRGTLVLDLTERSTGRLVWRATSDKRVTGEDVSERRLTSLLRQMTRSLPQR